ncbi:unnamed protein product, partial [Effrenium voratum]
VATAGSEKHVGMVKNWNTERGFGFLRSEGMEKDVFFPRRELPVEFQSEANINGHSFTYELTSAADGRPQARALQWMGGTVAPQPSAGIENLGQRAAGQVKSFSAKGGYGFISMLPTGGDIFFAKRDLPVGMQENPI